MTVWYLFYLRCFQLSFQSQSPDGVGRSCYRHRLPFRTSSSLHCHRSSSNHWIPGICFLTNIFTGWTRTLRRPPPDNQSAGVKRLLSYYEGGDRWKSRHVTYSAICGWQFFVVVKAKFHCLDSCRLAAHSKSKTNRTVSWTCSRHGSTVDTLNQLFHLSRRRVSSKSR